MTSRQPCLLLLLLLLWISVTALQPVEGWLSGKTVTCDVEGQDVHVPFIAGDPCIKCRCSSGEVVCERNTCEAASGCHVLLYSGSKAASACCDVCKGCRSNGLAFLSGQIVQSRHDPCERSHCLAGVLTLSRTLCHALPCKNATFSPGRCCPSCPGCEHDGRLRAHGETFSLRSDPCSVCTCQDGATTCEKTACPVLNCADTAVVQPPGQCCPVCQGKRKIFDIPQVCLFRGKTYRHGHALTVDDCSRCSCQNGTMICQQATCHRKPSLPCTFDGLVKEHGATWESRCSSCACDNGTTHCLRRSCPATDGGTSCPASHEWKYLQDDCCPTCVEKDSVCSFFGEAHYRAFDGEIRDIQGGSCKHVLAKDCGGGGAFSVTVSGQASRHGTPSTWLKSVVLSSRSGGRVRLLRGGEVRVDRRAVKLPYEIVGELSITRDDDDNVVAEHVDEGVKVVWNTDGYLEVHVPTRYRGRTCGLCAGGGGAIAAAADDEFLGRANGALQADVGGAFAANSWRPEGDDGGCSASAAAPSASPRLSTPPPPPLQQCQENVARWRRAHQECAPMKSSAFAACSAKVSVAPYYSACVADSCTCPKHRRCACDSLTAYERACELAGYAGRRSIVAECRNRVRKARLRSRS